MEIDTKDVINRLPEEVIGMILSLLPLKEAVRTSVVCRAWRVLWSNYFSGSVTLEPPQVPPQICYLLREEMPSCLSEFACSVDQLLLEKLKYPFLKEFKVAFFLNYPSIASNIDRWIHAVAAKQVEKLDLDFLDVIRPPVWSYNFSWPEGCRCLKVLRLSFISVSGEMLEGILAGCPLLQELSVSKSRVLAGFRVLHHEALKHLEICDCTGSAEKVLITVVSAPNLVYFKFGGNGRFAHISLVNVPCLTQVIFLTST
ncbi:hypothetical protein DM860_008371 [Cuscuta australis]|uniref:F-box domain-containing protein n=1 Tax=Cuscuta australis TaxID=267555 RepID=A0A328D7D0_9ASTE|nr:hypothetical protein DM860_008371 [Cuscuta australis]